MPHLEHHKVEEDHVDEIKSVSRPNNKKKELKKQKREENTVAENERTPIAFGLGQMYVPSELVGHE